MFGDHILKDLPKWRSFLTDSWSILKRWWHNHIWPPTASLNNLANLLIWITYVDECLIYTKTLLHMCGVKQYRSTLNCMTLLTTVPFLWLPRYKNTRQSLKMAGWFSDRKITLFNSVEIECWKIFKIKNRKMLTRIPVVRGMWELGMNAL